MAEAPNEELLHRKNVRDSAERLHRTCFNFTRTHKPKALTWSQTKPETMKQRAPN